MIKCLICSIPKKKMSYLIILNNLFFNDSNLIKTNAIYPKNKEAIKISTNALKLSKFLNSLLIKITDFIKNITVKAKTNNLNNIRIRVFSSGPAAFLPFGHFTKNNSLMSNSNSSPT